MSRKNCGGVADHRTLLPRKEGEARIVLNSSVGIDSTNQRPSQISGVRHKECEISDAEPRWQGFDKSTK